jgi:AcrR family transcriptional regulator
MKREARRAQIIEATLDLLAELPPDAISTRAIAAKVGVTQPALFRHFRTREDILLAVVTHARTHLGQVLGGIEGPPLDRAATLVRALVDWATVHPGLPRLLFADVVAEQDDRLRVALTSLVESQRELFGGLVAQGCPTVDARAAAVVLIAGLQGLLLQARRDGRPADVGPLLAMWRSALEAGVPAAPVVAPAAPEDYIEVDARAYLARSVDPLAVILAARKRLAPGGTLRVLAPFRPVPLETVLRGFGLIVEDAQVGDTWIVTARAPAVPA